MDIGLVEEKSGAWRSKLAQIVEQRQKARATSRLRRSTVATDHLYNDSTGNAESNRTVYTIRSAMRTGAPALQGLVERKDAFPESVGIDMQSIGLRDATNPENTQDIGDTINAILGSLKKSGDDETSSHSMGAVLSKQGICISQQHSQDFLLNRSRIRSVSDASSSRVVRLNKRKSDKGMDKNIRQRSKSCEKSTTDTSQDQSVTNALYWSTWDDKQLRRAARNMEIVRNLEGGTLPRSISTVRSKKPTRDTITFWTEKASRHHFQCTHLVGLVNDMENSFPLVSSDSIQKKKKIVTININSNVT